MCKKNENDITDKINTLEKDLKIRLVILMLVSYQKSKKLNKKSMT